MAERLIYRRPAEQLTVASAARPVRPTSPARRSKLTVETRDEKGEPAPAVVMLARGGQERADDGRREDGPRPCRRTSC